ncbi:hypothetical protein SNEBB_001759 [Seison nebaliae]|nr:hypothetical protein SNEBB_001759 [Seison nebaliae]
MNEDKRKMDDAILSYQSMIGKTAMSTTKLKMEENQCTHFGQWQQHDTPHAMNTIGENPMFLNQHHRTKNVGFIDNEITDNSSTVVDDQKRGENTKDRRSRLERGESIANIIYEKKQIKNRISSWQAGWNVTNAIQGMFMVSLPYVVLHGGYYTLFFLGFCSFMGYYSGCILVDCLYEETMVHLSSSSQTDESNINSSNIRKVNEIKKLDEITRLNKIENLPNYSSTNQESMALNCAENEVSNITDIISVEYRCNETFYKKIDDKYIKFSRTRIRDTYGDIAAAVMGEKIGPIMVNIAQTVELLMTCTLYMVLCGDLLVGAWAHTPLDQRTWTILAAVCLVPCAIIKHLRAVSWLSFLNTVVHVLINIIIVFYCISHIKDWHWSEVPVRVDMKQLPISLGIIIFSYTSQIFLPTLEGNLSDRHNFRRMLKWSHIAAGSMKTVFAIVGYLTWGMQTQEVIVNNIPSASMRRCLNVTLVFKAMFSFALPFYAAVELLEGILFVDRSFSIFPSCYDEEHRFKLWAIILRVLLIIIILLMAILTPHFALLMALIGSISGTLLSLIWPAWFHLRLKWNDLSLSVKIWDSCFIVIGVACSIAGIIDATRALIKVSTV